MPTQCFMEERDHLLGAPTKNMKKEVLKRKEERRRENTRERDKRRENKRGEEEEGEAVAGKGTPLAPFSLLSCEFQTNDGAVLEDADEAGQATPTCFFREHAQVQNQFEAVTTYFGDEPARDPDEAFARTVERNLKAQALGVPGKPPPNADADEVRQRSPM